MAVPKDNKYTKIITNLWHRSIARYLSKRRGQMVKTWLSGDVLDIGCGGEYPLTEFLQLGQGYVGVDIQEEVIRRLQKENPDYRYYCIDIEENSLTDIIKDRFDTVVMLAVIEHLRSPESVLRQCRNLLKPDGKLIITTPTSGGDKIIRSVKSLLGVKHEEQSGYSPHRFSFDQAGLTSLLAEQGEFRVIKYQKFELGLNQVIIASL